MVHRYLKVYPYIFHLFTVIITSIVTMKMTFKLIRLPSYLLKTPHIHGQLFFRLFSPEGSPIISNSVQFSSVTQSCLTLCDPTNRSTPGHPAHHHLPEFTQIRPSSPWCHPAISSSVVPSSSCLQSLPASESFPMSQLFAWGGQSTGVSALASFLPKNTQGWSPSEWTG